MIKLYLLKYIVNRSCVVLDREKFESLIRLTVIFIEIRDKTASHVIQKKKSFRCLKTVPLILFTASWKSTKWSDQLLFCPICKKMTSFVKYEWLSVPRLHCSRKCALYIIINFFFFQKDVMCRFSNWKLTCCSHHKTFCYIDHLIFL